MQTKDSEVVTPTAQWDAPGPGQWICEASHFPRPVTASIELLLEGLARGGMRTACERYGLPIDGFTFRAVNGWVYSTLDVVPPGELADRERTADRVLDERPWLDDVARWEEVEKPRWIARNLAFQDVPIDRLDDAELADHLRALVDLAVEGSILHFELHLADMIPTGMLLAATRADGVPDSDVLAGLAGCSPASRPDADLVGIADVVRARGSSLTSIDDVAALGGDVAEALDRYLRKNAFVTVSRWDVDAPCIGEHPALTLAAIERLVSAPLAPPTANRLLYELAVEPQLLDDAIATFGLRDDNVTILGSCSMGLLRRALLEAGLRLVRRGSMPTSELALEATGLEVAALLDGKASVDATELASRRAARRDAWDASPPPVLGDVDLDLADQIGPSSMALFEGLGIYGELMEAPSAARLAGLGIGDRTYVGRAVVAHSTEEALDDMTPGDVLVAWATSPAFDCLLSIAGAVVTVTGGLLSHAAVTARELGIPAVLGVTGATFDIMTGDLVHVDPVAGRVTVLPG